VEKDLITKTLTILFKNLIIRSLFEMILSPMIIISLILDKITIVSLTIENENFKEKGLLLDMRKSTIQDHLKSDMSKMTLSQPLLLGNTKIF